MIKDKYSALWVSHSSISDYLNCPRAYYLNNVYKDPQTRHKINLMSPPLALGQAVHTVLESLSALPAEKRFSESLAVKFDNVWKKFSGERGGFFDKEIEQKYKKRGQEMIKAIVDDPGPLGKLAVKIQMDLPYFWLSEEDNIILCGKIDWLEYKEEKDSVRIIDFKTGANLENSESLQLPIYYLLASNCQKRKIEGVSYWYLGRDKTPTEQPLPDLSKSREKILGLAKKIKLAKQLQRFKCVKENGCRACKPLEAIIRGEGKFVGTDEFGQDIYVLDKSREEKQGESVVL